MDSLIDNSVKDNNEEGIWSETDASAASGDPFLTTT